jgi:hypothetical protein
MMRRKMTIFLITLVIVFGTVGCGDNSEKPVEVLDDVNENVIVEVETSNEVDLSMLEERLVSLVDKYSENFSERDLRILLCGANYDFLSDETVVEFLDMSSEEFIDEAYLGIKLHEIYDKNIETYDSKNTNKTILELEDLFFEEKLINHAMELNTLIDISFYGSYEEKVTDQEILVAYLFGYENEFIELNENMLSKDDVLLGNQASALVIDYLVYHLTYSIEEDVALNMPNYMSMYEMQIAPWSLYYANSYDHDRKTEALDKIKEMECAFPEEVYENGYRYLDTDRMLFEYTDENFIVYQLAGITEASAGSEYYDSDWLRERNIIVYFDNYGVISDVVMRIGYFYDDGSGEISYENKVDENEEQFEEFLVMEESDLNGTVPYDIVNDMNDFEKGTIYLKDNYIYKKYSLKTVCYLNKYLIENGEDEQSSVLGTLSTNIDELFNSFFYFFNDYGFIYEKLYVSDMNINEEAEIINNYCDISDFPYSDQIDIITDDYFVLLREDYIQSGDFDSEVFYSIITYYFFDDEGVLNSVGVVYYDLPSEDYDRMSKSMISLSEDALVEYNYNPERNYFPLEFYSYKRNTKSGIYFDYLYYYLTGYENFDESVEDIKEAVYLSEPRLY